MTDTTDKEPEGIDVAYVAHLARLNLTAEETAIFAEQLAQVVNYVDEIRELDLSGIEPTSHAHPLTNVFRADEARPGLSRDTVLANAPASKAGQFVVPRIIE